MDKSVREARSYAFGPFRLDPARRVLTRGGAPLALAPTVFDTLLHLVENPGRVVSKTELLDAVWPGRTVEEANVSQAIFVLRKALIGAADDDRLIVTAPGRGYRFTARVRVDEGATAAREWTLPRPLGGESGAKARRRRLAIWGAAGLTAAMIFGGAAAWLRLHREGRVPPQRSAIVLTDFRNLTGEPIFSRTLASALEIDLDQSPFLTVLTSQRVQDTLALMTRATTEPVTAALAQEICARDNGGAVVGGSIASLGSKYLLTLTATDCSGTHTLAAAKAVATDRAAVISALDGLAAELRRSLGESRLSVLAYNVPLLPERTASLDALKSYSNGYWLYEHGQPIAAIPLLQNAVDIDPNLTSSYTLLSIIYSSFYEDPLASANISRAYALRNYVGQRDRFLISALYEKIVTRDLDSSLRNIRLWSTIYPNDASAWDNLADASDYIGRYDQEILAAKRALALDPSVETPYAALARAYLGAGRSNQSLAIARQAVVRGVAGDDVHEVLLLIAFTRRDGATLRRQIAWAAGKPAERTMLVRQDEIALGQGRIADANRAFAREVELGREQGLPDDSRSSRARILVDLGLPDQARAVLSSVRDDANPDYLITLASIDAPSKVEAMLAASLRAHRDDTLLNAVYAPQVRAVLALRAGKPAMAIAALAPAVPYESCDFDVPYLLGSARLALGDGRGAAADFETILAHQGWDPTSPLFSLARLGLGRALLLQGQRLASANDYRTFLADWRNADPDVPILRAAEAEYARL